MKKDKDKIVKQFREDVISLQKSSIEMLDVLGKEKSCTKTGRILLECMNDRCKQHCGLEKTRNQEN
ncbi:hypothetical protein DRJ17_01105 [Candidatus Woesearchaeota archaeon]|nr:MAG: hypothetical protein DRJ17_01105 [Candidatus Woesearchaeota archaeon]